MGLFRGLCSKRSVLGSKGSLQVEEGPSDLNCFPADLSCSRKSGFFGPGGPVLAEV
jgi:hypothetical protein